MSRYCKFSCSVRLTSRKSELVLGIALILCFPYINSKSPIHIVIIDVKQDENIKEENIILPKYRCFNIGIWKIRSEKSFGFMSTISIDLFR